MISESHQTHRNGFRFRRSKGMFGSKKARMRRRQSSRLLSLIETNRVLCFDSRSIAGRWTAKTIGRHPAAL